MERLERILSRPAAKPYRSQRLTDSNAAPFLNEAGHVDFAPGDIENPKNWSVRRRAYITVVAVLLVVNATFASTSPSGCLEGIAAQFHVSVEATNLVLTLFLLGYCAGPLVFAPLSEFYGRRYVFYVSFSLYFASSFLCAFAPSFAALLVGRFLCGTFVSAPLSNAPGVLADIWGPIARGNAMAVFSTMTFVGPALGPVISGFLELTESWRWSFYVLLWLAAATELLMFTIPETLPAVVLTNKARRIRAALIPGYESVLAPAEAADRSLRAIFRVALTRPWRILVDPISFLVAIYVSVVYALLYMLFTIYPIVFQQRRGWNAGVGELPLLGAAVGACIGGGIVFAASHRDAAREARGHVRVAEDRLPVAMLGGCLFAATMFWFAWSGEFDSVHWAVPTVAGVFLATSILLIFVAYLNYLTDAYLQFTASAMAANTIVRSACGAAAPLYTQRMFDALGVGGGGSLIGGVAVLLAPIPFVFYRYGGAIRRRSRFAPTPGRSEAAEAAAAEEGEEEEEEEGAEGQNKKEADEEAAVGGESVEKVVSSRSGDSGESVESVESAESAESPSALEKKKELEGMMPARPEPAAARR